MTKILIIISSLIMLAITVETGYLWGIKRSEPLNPSGTNIIKQSALSPTPYPNPTQFPVLDIPNLLSYKAAVAVSQSTLNSKIWQSDWTIGFGGNLTSLGENAVSIYSSDGEKRTINFPAGIKIIYSQWNNTQRVSAPSNSSEFKPGDDIGINFTIETTSGNFKKIELIKNVD